MKIIKLFTPVLAIMLFFSSILSCKKDSTPTPIPTYPIQGLWIGTYLSDQYPALAPQYYSFIIKPDGTMICEARTEANANQNLSKGTWTLTGTAFSCTYTNIWGSGSPSYIGLSQSANATFDNTGKLTSGTFRNTTTTGTGTFIMTRVN